MQQNDKKICWFIDNWLITKVDFTPSIQHILGNTVDIVEAGGLDRIGDDYLHSITHDKDEITYISKLINGQSIKIGKSKLLPLLQEELNKLEEQRNILTQKWNSTGVEFCVEVASPYEDSDIKGSAQKLENQGIELIILDCMGYNEKHKKDAMEGSGLPVLLPRTLTARIVAEYV